ncbi:MAG: class I SAM-dependent methyltransferase [SAR324 cluster bacterium]|nr:class I SAM-dependent methyltransferase [SAR324 cluster bacterium]
MNYLKLKTNVANLSSGVKTITRKMLWKYGYEIIWHNKVEREKRLPPEFSQEDMDILHSVKSYTMTSEQRVLALIKATRYVYENEISGDIVECGVYKGGSMMAVAQTLCLLHSTDKTLYLYDTFEGMPAPVLEDGEHAQMKFNKMRTQEDRADWCRAPLAEVQANMFSTGYNPQKMIFIKGKVQDTIPRNIPDKISLLRLDTDFYESTQHELAHLFPRLSHGGVIILDDYGYWQGQKKAMDEYIRNHKIKLLLNIIDDAGRIGVKV